MSTDDSTIDRTERHLTAHDIFRRTHKVLRRRNILVCTRTIEFPDELWGSFFDSLYAVISHEYIRLIDDDPRRTFYINPAWAVIALPECCDDTFSRLAESCGRKWRKAMGKGIGRANMMRVIQSNDLYWKHLRNGLTYSGKP
jgi:hypothetical protein